MTRQINDQAKFPDHHQPHVFLDDDIGRTETARARVVQKRHFVDRVVAETGVSRNTARSVVELTLHQLGLAFAAGETLAVPPFGRARVSRKTDLNGGEIINLRLRRRLEMPGQ